MRELMPGDRVALRKRNRLYDAKVLAVIGPESLIEYSTRVRGCTSLVFGPSHISGGIVEYHRRNAYGYRHLPQQWLNAIILAGQEWVGRSRAGKVEDVAVLRSMRDE